MSILGGEDNCVVWQDQLRILENILKNLDQCFICNLKWDYLKLLLDELNLVFDQLPPINSEFPVTPYSDLGFPIAHGHILQINNLIPSKSYSISHFVGLNNQLRSTSKLLCRIGRSMVAEQYHRMNQGKIKLSGVKPLRLTPETIGRVRDLLAQTIPGAGVAVARLRWKQKNLGDLYKLTCVKEGCCFQPYSFGHLIMHLKMGHYNLVDLLQDPNDYHLTLLNSPSLYYPVNPLKTFLDASTYICQKCNLHFISYQTIHTHYLKRHNENIADINELSIFETCNFCGELVDKDSKKMEVCRLHLNKETPEFLWNQIRKYLEYDPARAIGSHVLLSLMLYPNENSPLLIVKNVLNKIQEPLENNFLDISYRFISAISAFRGIYHICEEKSYTGAVDGILDIQKLEDSLQNFTKRPYDVISMDHENLRGQKKSRIEVSYYLKEHTQLAEKSSNRESFESTKINVVFENSLNRPENGRSESSRYKTPSIVGIVPPRIIERPKDPRNAYVNPFDLRSHNAVVLAKLKALPNTSHQKIQSSLAILSNKSDTSNSPSVLPRILSIKRPSYRDRRSIALGDSNSSDMTNKTGMSLSVANSLSKSCLVSNIVEMNPTQLISNQGSPNVKSYSSRSICVTSKKLVRVINPPIEGSKDIGSSYINHFEMRSPDVVVKESSKTVSNSSRKQSYSILGDPSNLIPSVSSPLCRGQQPNMPHTSNPPDVTNVTSTLDSIRSLSSSVGNNLSNNLTTKSCLFSKIMEMNQTQPIPSQCSSSPKSGLPSSENSGAVGEILASGEERGSFVIGNVTRKTPVQKLSPRCIMPKEPSISSRHIDISNRVGAQIVSCPFDSPKAANLINRWSKRFEEDVSVVKHAKETRDVLKNNRLYMCKYCGLSFEKLEIFWAHIVRQHPNRNISANKLCTVNSAFGERNLAGLYASSVPKSSIDHTQKLTSSSSANLTPLNGRKTFDWVSKEQENLNPSTSANRKESKSDENKNRQIVLWCPLCKLSSTSREAIMKHVLEKH